MALWFLRGLRRGIVTTRYPSADDPSAASLPTPPVFDPRAIDLRLADRLVESCPARALVRQERVLVFDIGACTGCGRCITISQGALRPSGEFELATTRRDGLVKRISIEDR